MNIEKSKILKEKYSDIESALKSSNLDIRRGAARLVAKSSDPNKIDMLLELLGDEDKLVVYISAKELSKFNDVKIVEGLLDLLRNDLSVHSVNAAIKLLKDMDCKKAVDLIIDKLGCERTRSSAVYALSKLDGNHWEALLSFNKVTDFYMRLVEVGGLKTVDVIKKAMNYGEFQTRRRAASAFIELSKLYPEEGILSPVMISNLCGKFRIGTSQDKLYDTDEVESLINCLTAKSGDARKAAASELIILAANNPAIGLDEFTLHTIERGHTDMFEKASHLDVADKCRGYEHNDTKYTHTDIGIGLKVTDF